MHVLRFLRCVSGVVAAPCLLCGPYRSVTRSVREDEQIPEGTSPSGEHSLPRLADASGYDGTVLPKTRP